MRAGGGGVIGVGWGYEKGIRGYSGTGGMRGGEEGIVERRGGGHERERKRYSGRRG